MQTFLENHHLIWYAIAGLSLVVELGIMGLSGPLLFFALASIVTGVLVHLELVTSWQAQILVVGIASAIIAALLWQPLKKIQNPSSKTDTSSDMIGLKVPVVEDITEIAGSIRYSGVNWQARLAEGNNESKIAADEHCEIVAVTGTTMLVKAI